MGKQLAKWKDDAKDMETKLFYTIIMGWFWATCTKDPSRGDYSILNTRTPAVPRDRHSLEWTMKHLHSILPAPPRTRTPPEVPPVPVPVPGKSETPRERENHVLFDRILTLSSSLLDRTLDRDRPSETAKTLSKVEACRILGHCGLTWSERHLMPTIWADLKKTARLCLP
jgi:hypothetical protein